MGKSVPQIYPFPAIQHNCLLLSYMLIHFGSLHCKQYGPRSDCSFMSSLIWFHNVLTRQKYFGVYLNIFKCTSDIVSRKHFQVFKFWHTGETNDRTFSSITLILTMFLSRKRHLLMSLLHIFNYTPEYFCLVSKHYEPRSDCS